MIAVGLLDHIPHHPVATRHKPWPRVRVDEDGWDAAIDHLVSGRMTLLGLWGEATAVHMALLGGELNEAVVASFDCKSGAFPSVGARHAPALRLERAACDLFGLRAMGTADARP